MAWFLLGVSVFVCGFLGYRLWLQGEDLGYWQARSVELSQQLDRVSDGERLEAIERATARHQAGISVSHEDEV